MTEVVIKRKTISITRKVISLCVSVVLLAVIILGVSKAVLFMQKTGITPGLMFQIIFNDGAKLESSHERTNVLILGKSGGAHAGADLTDTIIILSLNNTKQTAALISIPRDTWSVTLQDKVNSAYYYGEEKQKGGGMTLAKVVAEDVIGMPIQYVLMIDFSGFKNMIDIIGGIDVNVSSAFTDNEYPILGKEYDTCPEDPTNRCVYETVHFDAGMQHMDGDRALIYVRSRHAEGEEGSDFARSRRQQDILIALKDTLVNPTRWVTLRSISLLPKAIDDASETDMNMGELLTVGKQFLKTKEADVKKIAFDSQLVEPDPISYKGLFVLVPNEDWKTLHLYIAGQLN